MNSNFGTAINSKIDLINSLPVISGYYLVLGGGKIGNKFVEYAKKHNLPFILVIDIDCEAPASMNADILSDKDNLIEAINSLSIHKTGYYNSKWDQETAAYGSDIYFYCMDVKDIPSLLVHGIPEYIVPAIPSHAAVDIVVDFLRFDGNRKTVQELSIDEEDNESSELFNNMVSAFPEDIVAGKVPEDGTIFFSYARPGKMCPDNCKGQEGYCYTFERVKPKTITSYVRERAKRQAGWVFESYQMGPGIGGIRGIDLKENLILIMKHVCCLKEDSSGLSSEDRYFFIATTCNCHGILNMLYVV
ncbi:hypothetical protein V7O62_04890 [Methanolobus sp. ZRKC2]|uniref:hypothetical protein n=1 Tax=Methanolobus sp. ZRKC2 TaxID=3125783 RepID=UPI0032565C7D